MNLISIILVIFNVDSRFSRKFLIRINHFLCLVSMQPLLVFSARTIIERTDRNVLQSIETDQSIDGKKKVVIVSNYWSFFLGTIHAYVRLDGLASVIISNNDYPKQVVHNLLNRVWLRFFIDSSIFFTNSKVIEDFTKFYPSTSWENMPEG